jgi:hypothetical protein
MIKRVRGTDTFRDFAGLSGVPFTVKVVSGLLDESRTVILASAEIFVTLGSLSDAPIPSVSPILCRPMRPDRSWLQPAKILEELSNAKIVRRGRK